MHFVTIASHLLRKIRMNQGNRIETESIDANNLLDVAFSLHLYNIFKTVKNEIRDLIKV